MSTYRLAEVPPSTVRDALASYHPLLQQLLFTRGITTKAAADSWLHPNYDTELHDPWRLPHMEAAVERILRAIDAKEPIVIYSDYDCDGIPGGVILHDFFTTINYEHFSNYIPHRHFEGFGFNVEAAETLAKGGAKLIITIDCGTSDIAAVAKANELGVDVIITDHHEPGEVVPDALAIVNPKLNDSYPFDGLCGAAVIFKVVQALLERGSFDIHPGREKWWLDMVGIATIADMVPLIDENRVLAHYGLKVLRKSRRPGLQQLLQKQRVKQTYLTEDDIGFTIGPRINAASRMGTPQDALALLASKTVSEAALYVDKLEALNNERKGIVASMSREANGRLKKLPELPPVLVLGNPEWRPSLAGLVANKLAEEYKRPAFVWGRDGQGVIKGSCRSDGQVSVVELMRAAELPFLEQGGHHFSGGFAVADRDIHDLPKALIDAATNAGEAATIDETITLDARLTLEDITPDLKRVHEQAGPFGADNPKPLYEFKDLTPREISQFGKGKEHLKLSFMSLQGPIEAIAFYKTPADWKREPTVDESLTLIGHVEHAYFMGRPQTRIRIVEIL